MICLKDFEQFFLAHSSYSTREFYRNGANQEGTLRNNESAFDNLVIRPKLLARDVSERSTQTRFLGQTVTTPIAVAPTGYQALAHSQGELATAQACEKVGTVFIQSTVSNYSIEEVAQAAPGAIKWFQLYVHRDTEFTIRLIRRAEKAGFRALVVTIDTPIIGQRLGEIRSKFCLPSHLKVGNFDHKMAAEFSHSNNMWNSALTWTDIKWLKGISKLPVLVKGILTAEDASLALQVGVSGIIVSNHGGRQLDSVPATIEALPEVVKAVGGRCEVYMDGGIRTGTDVLKAIALGAKGVFIGRPILWGLTYNGQPGVEQVINCVTDELSSAMGLTGCAKIDHITKDLVVHKSFYSKL
ncbi:Hydroxyacid oxidase 1 [Halotydeus destructor]|nr:Hydroxyacid oxidase 1 [Halotydeus destructor]